MTPKYNSATKWTTRDRKSTDDEAWTAEFDYGTRRREGRTVPLSIFLTTVIVLSILAITMSLGIGLGLQRTIISIIYQPLPPHNYSEAYGVPEGLTFVPIEDLINNSELALDTNFRHNRTGNVVRDYVFNITQALAAPDGFTKPMILVNGQSPGPLIEANTGDTIRVHVHNQMSSSSTTIHWHGIDQKNSTWMDGVVGVSQCGIPPGESFTYEFTVAKQRGTFWWHAHLSVQYSDGIYGPLVIHDPDEMIPDHEDEKIVFLGDVYHTYGSVLLSSYLSPTSRWTPTVSGVEPLADNLLMNGQNTYDCSVVSTTYPPQPDQPYTADCTGGSLSTTTVQAGQTTRLRLINSSSFFSFWFSVDNHTLSVVELDGVEIQPISSRGVYVNIGQRVSVLLTANQTAGNYYMRASIPKTCYLPYAPYTSAGLEAAEYGVRGVLSYAGTEVAAEPIGVAGNTTNPYGVEHNGNRGDAWEGCDDMPFDMPVPMRHEPAVEVSENNMHYIEYMFRQAQDVNRIFVNKTAYTPLHDNATLWKATEQSAFAQDAQNSYSSWDFGLNQQVLLLPDADRGAQIVINSRDAMEHPWHLHGKIIFHQVVPYLAVVIVGWGPGYFGQAGNASSTSTTTWNLESPMRRDTVTVPAFTHVVIRFPADNPGVWALHCHVAWHMEGGMFVSLAERPDDLASLVDRMDPATRNLSRSFCKPR
ncbi:multicopper oxidase-domain-containing protein [Microdochium bolleyi]|uniref:Multicopper oxidase-domain-containing protein n=1 Tax=Microdochium bolleyi TaxID=196109 RepID=A0A136J5G8_9PEZI|nr:multicopper oxidase-domain-containing protein [Microdochium bolleyi]